jgi:hypothetical protein
MLEYITPQGSTDEEWRSVWDEPDSECNSWDSERDVLGTLHPLMSPPKPEEQEEIKLKRLSLHKFKKKQLGKSFRECFKPLRPKKATPEPYPPTDMPFQLDTIRLDCIADELKEIWHKQGDSNRMRPLYQHEEPTREWQFDEDVVPPVPDFTVRQPSRKSLGDKSGSGSSKATSKMGNDSWFSRNGSSHRKMPCHQHEESNREWQFDEDVVPPMRDFTDKQSKKKSLRDNSGNGSTEGTSNKENNSWIGEGGKQTRRPRGVSFSTCLRPCHQHEEPSREWHFDEDVRPSVPDFTVNHPNNSRFSPNGSSPRRVVDLPERFDISHNEDLEIQLDEGPNFDFILRRLTSNLMVRNLEIARAKGQESFVRSPKELVSFFSAVKTLRRLESVVYKNFSEESMAIMADWMYFHPTLKHVHVHFVSGAVDSTFLEALNSITTLEEVELDMRESFSMSDILRSNVRILRVLSHDFEFYDSHILQLARKLGTNKSLVLLNLEPKLSVSSLGALSRALRINRTLQKFFFSFTNKNLGKKNLSKKNLSKKNLSEGHSVLLQMMNALEGKTMLRVVCNHYSDHVHVNEEFMDLVLESLKKNDTLEKFRLFDEDFEFYQAANRLLEENADRKHSQVGSSWMCIDDSIWLRFSLASSFC